jgi:hypothetical protein
MSTRLNLIAGGRVRSSRLTETAEPTYQLPAHLLAICPCTHAVSWHSNNTGCCHKGCWCPTKLRQLTGGEMPRPPCEPPG